MGLRDGLGGGWEEDSREKGYMYITQPCKAIILQFKKSSFGFSVRWGKSKRTFWPTQHMLKLRTVHLQNSMYANTFNLNRDYFKMTKKRM